MSVTHTLNPFPVVCVCLFLQNNYLLKSQVKSSIVIFRSYISWILIMW